MNIDNSWKMNLWLSSSLIVSRSVPDSYKWVPKAWRKEWQFIFESSPSFLRCSKTWLLNTAVLQGLLGACLVENPDKNRCKYNAFVMYNKSITKINLVQNIARELHVPPVKSYFLCDCWYVSEKTINTFAIKGFYTIEALKTNRMLYPFGIWQNPSAFASLLSVTHTDFHLVTMKKQKYYVYRYERKLDGIENAVVLLNYPEKALGKPNALRAFLSTDVLLSTDEILSYYVCQWPIEVFFYGSVRINWHWTATWSILHRESEGTGWLCHWHIICVL